MLIEEISINNKKYPEKLRNIYDAPKKLYVIGNKEILNQKGIAIVGSRKATQYGKNVTLEMSKELSKRGINIISGLAVGIDSYAHIGCLGEKGKTIAILGNGLDTIYPVQNRKLAKAILENDGCIISEYPIGAKIEKRNFPQRNRLISGLSDGILIVEANKKSGALITAEFGLEQGKEIFVIPGDITREQSEGCNILIKEGANVVTSCEDISSYLQNLTFLQKFDTM